MQAVESKFTASLPAFGFQYNIQGLKFSGNVPDLRCLVFGKKKKKKKIVI